MTTTRNVITSITMMALATLAACSADDSSEQAPATPTATISFAGDMASEQTVTRAGSSLADKGVKAFFVYGTKNMDASTYQQVFPRYKVNWNSGSWEYVDQQEAGQTQQTVKYWDFSALAYRFFATTEAEVTLLTDGSAYRATFDADADNDNEAGTPYYSSLWYRAAGSTDIGKAVTLQFMKPFSKVRIMFTFEKTDDAATTVLSDISFKPGDGTTIKRAGTISVTYPLTGPSTSEVLRIEGEPSGITALTRPYVSGTNEYWYTVLPTPAGQAYYTLNISVNGEPKSTTVPAEYMNWQPCYKYTYVFKVHVDGSVTIDNVQSAFTDWIIRESDRTLYNW